MRTWMLRIALMMFLVLLQSSASEANSCLEQSKKQAASASNDPCWKEASSQLAINECAAKELRKSDADLNDIYQHVLQKYSRNPQALSRIRKAQRSWLAFRDMEIESLFPENERSQSGSVFPMCRALALARITS